MRQTAARSRPICGTELNASGAAAGVFRVWLSGSVSPAIRAAKAGERTDKGTTTGDNEERQAVIKLLIVLVVVSIVAGALGFTGIARGAASAAKLVFFLLLAIILALIVLGALGIVALF